MMNYRRREQEIGHSRAAGRPGDLIGSYEHIGVLFLAAKAEGSTPATGTIKQ